MSKYCIQYGTLGPAEREPARARLLNSLVLSGAMCLITGRKEKIIGNSIFNPDRLQKRLHKKVYGNHHLLLT